MLAEFSINQIQIAKNPNTPFQLTSFWLISNKSFNFENFLQVKQIKLEWTLTIFQGCSDALYESAYKNLDIAIATSVIIGALQVRISFNFIVLL